MATHKNLSTMIFLVNTEVRAIAVTYEPVDLTKNTTKQKYDPPYLSAGKIPEGAYVFKTMDHTIKVDDYVVVPTNTRHGLTVCQVVAVDVEIDFNSDIEHKWIVGPVSMDNFERIRQEEDRMLAAVKQAQANDKREELRRSLLGSLKGHEDSIPMLTAPQATEGKEEKSSA